MTDPGFKINYYLEVDLSFLSTGKIVIFFVKENDKNAIIATMRTTLGKYQNMTN